MYGGVKLSTIKQFLDDKKSGNQPLSRGIISSQNNHLHEDLSLCSRSNRLMFQFSSWGKWWGRILPMQNTNLIFNWTKAPWLISFLLRSGQPLPTASSVYSLLHCSQGCGLLMLLITVMLLVKREGKLCLSLTNSEKWWKKFRNEVTTIFNREIFRDLDILLIFKRKQTFTLYCSKY